ncbi:MAG: bifunctional 3-hydroxydecanoyl-ACP dehydratase/trans-2-decenoyl-ACP isomerase [Elusimicrobia bacterium]|nr:bifunctional 3-hydroxydecanoyl-ACP dehydratase/trans-2-decenoyl-ACP isomerase [Elusimicrobiota bacterium]
MKFEEFRKKSSFSREEILSFISGRLLEDAPPGLPALPAALLAPFHEVTSISWDAASGTGRIEAVRRNRLDEWFYPCHFQGDPVMPGCWGVDAAWQCLRFFAAWRGLSGCGKTMGMENVSFFGQIRPYDDNIVYAVDVVSVETSDGETMLTGKASVSVDGALVYTIGSLSVATAFWTDDAPTKPATALPVKDAPIRKLRYDEFSARTMFNHAEIIALSQGALIDAPGLEVGLLPSALMLEVGTIERIAFDEATGEGRISASRGNGPLEWFYPMTPGVKPAVLSIDAVWQLMGLFLTWRQNPGTGRALGFERVEVFGDILPGDRDIRYEVAIVRYSRMPNGDAFVRADAKVRADGRLILACTNLNVGCHKNIRYEDYPFPSEMATGGKLKVRSTAAA